MTGGRGPFIPLGEGPVEDDLFASLPGSGTVDRHGHTVGADQASSATVVSAPLILGPGATPSSTPRSTSFALQQPTTATLTSDVHGGTLVFQSQPASQSSTGDPSSQLAAQSNLTVPACPICDARFREPTALWKHLNHEHIARRVFPSAAFLEQHGRRLCGNPTCSLLTQPGGRLVPVLWVLVRAVVVEPCWSHLLLSPPEVSDTSQRDPASSTTHTNSTTIASGSR